MGGSVQWRHARLLRDQIERMRTTIERSSVSCRFWLIEAPLKSIPAKTPRLRDQVSSSAHRRYVCRCLEHSGPTLDQAATDALCSFRSRRPCPCNYRSWYPFTLDCHEHRDQVPCPPAWNPERSTGEADKYRRTPTTPCARVAGDDSSPNSSSNDECAFDKHFGITPTQTAQRAIEPGTALSVCELAQDLHRS